MDTRQAPPASRPQSPENNPARGETADGPVLIGTGAALPEMMERRVRTLTDALVDLYGATDGTGRFLAAQAATAMARLEILPDVEADARRSLVERSAFCWEVDRAADAAKLGARLHKHPERINRQLMRTVQGCDWLLARLVALFVTLRDAAAATDEQLATLADLLGIAPELRAVDERVRPGTPIADRLELIREEIAVYRNARDRASRIDQADHRAAISGLGYERSAAGRRLFAYDQACMKRYLWAIDALEHRHPAAPIPEAPRSSVLAPAAPATPPASEPPAPAAQKTNPTAPAARKTNPTPRRPGRRGPARHHPVALAGPDRASEPPRAPARRGRRPPRVEAPPPGRRRLLTPAARKNEPNDPAAQRPRPLEKRTQRPRPPAH